MITALHRALVTQNAALAAKTRDQEAFIYSVSHDLRASLVSLQGLTTVLVEDYAPNLDPAAMRYIERIAANAQRMHALLNDLPHLQQVGQVELDYALVDLEAVVQNVVEHLGHTFKVRDVDVWLVTPLPKLWANPTRMVQLFNNLLDNAVQYTPADRTPLVQPGI